MDGNLSGKKTDAAIDHVINMSRVFAAPRIAVWKAWTEPDQVAAWMGPPGIKSKVDTWDFRVGGRYHLTMQEDDDHPLGGEFLEIIEGERLAMTWTWEHGVLDGVEMVVELGFRDVDGGTELALTHTRLPTEKAHDMHAGGWQGCLSELEAYLTA